MFTIFKSSLGNMAVSGHNGNNETKIGLSKLLSLAFFDEKGRELPVSESKKPIEFWITREKSVSDMFKYQYVNVTNMSLSESSYLLSSAFSIETANVSVHIQLKPVQSNQTSYLVLLKFGSTPVINSSTVYYDHFKILCSNSADFVVLPDDFYYMFFLNSSTVRGYKGFVGYSIRELTTNETDTYCVKGQMPTSPPTEATNFTVDYQVRVFTSGCYYYDLASGKWISHGLEVYADTTISKTHCGSQHLTQFAGGLIVLPSKINFEYVWANASFLKNPWIYTTVIVVTCLYVLLALWAYFMDRRDKLRLGVTLLSDNLSNDQYYYEVIVFTGTRSQAATDSNVKIIISGENSETDAILLKDEKRRVFRRGGIDSFVFPVKFSLGNLNYLRVWHDNSGKGRDASWFLKYIVVHDLQTREKSYFICQNWLAVEKDDGMIDRTLPAAGEKQKTQLRYLIRKQAYQNLSDGHLWFSVFARPAQSSFNRVDRVTCCFVLLYISMLMNIMYYGMGKGSNSGGLQVGPFYMTAEQVSKEIKSRSNNIYLK